MKTNKHNTAQSRLLWNATAAAGYELEEEGADERLAVYDERAGRNHEFTQKKSE